MEEMSEDELKSIIRSILTSTPNVSHIKSVLKDFREMVGSQIPYQTLGYNSVEHFLKSIPDVCMVEGSGPWAVVTPIVSEKAAHINDMVMKQKNNTNRRLGNCRRPKQTSYQRNRPNTSSTSYKSLGNDHSNSFHHPQVNKSQNQLICSPKPVETVKISTPKSNTETEMKTSINNPILGGSLPNRKQHLQNLLQQSIKDSPPSTSTLPNNAPVLDKEDEYFFTSKNLETFKPYLKDNPILTEVTQDVSANVPKSVQNNLRTLIGRFNEGIWCSQLPEEYIKMFKRELVYYKYGFTSLIEMCVALPDIFHYVRPGQDDFKLYDRSKPLPETIERNFTIASFDVNRPVDQHDAFPDLVWSDFVGHLPDDVFPFGEDIPRQFLSENAKVGDVLDVVVLEMYDPSKFWFYLGKSDKKAPLDVLMDDIQTFYKQPGVKQQYSVPPVLVKEGLYCVQMILEEYHRARVINLLPDTPDFVKVLYIDYGTVAQAPVKGMCFLHNQFAQLPAQAIRCRLANIMPVSAGTWPRSVRNYLRDRLNRCDTKLKVTFIDWNDEYVCGFLADVTDANDIVYLNELLVQKGMARWESEAQESPFILPDYKCRVNRLHLFPSFVELEFGLAPNVSEMYTLEDMLVPINLCIPQYFEPLDELDPAIEEELIERRENLFIETVKNYRKHLPHICDEKKIALEQPEFNFNFFNDMKDDIAEFIDGLSPDFQSKLKIAPDDELSQCQQETEPQKPVELVDLSENLLKQLETCKNQDPDLLERLEELNLLEDEIESQAELIERELSVYLDDDYVSLNDRHSGSGEDMLLSTSYEREEPPSSSDEDETKSSRLQRLLNSVKYEPGDTYSGNEVKQSYEYNFDDSQAESSTERLKSDFVASLSVNNPFRAYLVEEMAESSDPKLSKIETDKSSLSATSEPFVPKAAATISTQTSAFNNEPKVSAGLPPIALQTFAPCSYPNYRNSGPPLRPPIVNYPKWSDTVAPPRFSPGIRPPPGFEVFTARHNSQMYPPHPNSQMFFPPFSMPYVPNSYGYGMPSMPMPQCPDFYERYNREFNRPL